MMIPPIVVPKEHGAWAVLFVPMLTASIFAQSMSLDFLLLVLSTLMIFMSHAPLHTIFRSLSEQSQRGETYEQARFWARAYLALAVLLILPVLLHGHQSLIPIGLLAFAALSGNFFVTRGSPKTIPGDLIAVFGLTLSAPAAYYVLRGVIDQTALILWALNFLFFGYCVFYVHMKIRASATRKPFFSLKERIYIGRHLLLYHLLAATVLLYLILERVTPEYSLVAFLPVTTQTLYGTLKLSGKVRFKTLGLVLLGQSVLFGVLVGVLE